MKKIGKEKRLFYIFLFLLFILALGLLKKFFENDTFYTIKIGDWIIHHGIDMKDHFSIHAGLPYTYPHWLYDVFIYIIYYVGGFRGIFISSVGLFFILIYIVFKCNYRITNSCVASFFSVLIHMIVLGNFITARAQVLSFILFALEIYCLEMFVKTKKKRYGIELVLISLGLCNVHTAVWPFYFVLFLPYIVESIIYNLLKNKKTIKKSIVIDDVILLKPLFIIIIVSSLMGLITPIGLTPYTYFYKTIIGDSQRYIIEHQPVGGTELVFPIVIFAEMILVSFVSKIKLRDLFLLMGVSFMALFSIRHISLLALIGSICFSRIFKYFIDNLDFDLEKKAEYFFAKKRIVISSFAIMIIISSLLVYHHNKSGFVLKNLYPVDAVKFIKNNIEIDSMRILNEYDYGSYLILNDIPVFIDSRADLYTTEFNGIKPNILVDYFSLPLNLDQKLEFYNITHVLVRKDLNNYSVAKTMNNLKEIYYDDYFSLYEVITK